MSEVASEFRDTVRTLAAMGVARWKVANAFRLTEAELDAAMRGLAAPPDGNWQSEVTLLVQSQAAECEQYLNARGIVTGWHIWPTRWAKDEAKQSTVSLERRRPGLWERLRLTGGRLRGIVG